MYKLTFRVLKQKAEKPATSATALAYISHNSGKCLLAKVTWMEQLQWSKNFDVIDNPHRLSVIRTQLTQHYRLQYRILRHLHTG